MGATKGNDRVGDEGKCTGRRGGGITEFGKTVDVGTVHGRCKGGRGDIELGTTVYVLYGLYYRHPFFCNPYISDSRNPIIIFFSV